MKLIRMNTPQGVYEFPLQVVADLYMMMGKLLNASTTYIEKKLQKEND